MADSKEKKAIDVAWWSARLFNVGSRMAALVATRISRLLIVFVLILVGVYLSYEQAWKPILATAPLPPGVAEKSPQLNTDLLQKINVQRAERIEASRQQFAVEALLRPPTGP